MPAGWDGHDPFDRYRAAGLNVDAFAPRSTTSAVGTEAGGPD
jgi:hypothetical protein